jgi:hypothetical protein
MIYRKFIIYKSFANVAKFEYFGTVTHKNHIHDEDAKKFEVQDGCCCLSISVQSERKKAET